MSPIQQLVHVEGKLFTVAIHVEISLAPYDCVAATTGHTCYLACHLQDFYRDR